MNSTKRWSRADLRTIRRLYPNSPTAAIAKRLGRDLGHVYAKAGNLGLHKSPAYLASPAAHRLDGVVGKASRFQPGIVPWNKGKHYVAGGRSAETRFKPGNVSKRWDPEIYVVGALRINSDGYLEIKVRDGCRAWKPMIRFTWETERGPIPAGMVVRPLNGDPDDTRIKNLRLATRGEVMRENTLHNYPKPIARAIQLRGALIRQINRREKQHAEHA